MTEREARAAGWLRFSQVKEFVPGGQPLYRSSAPNYQKLRTGDHDASQNLTENAVNFLVCLGIDSIISFNKYAYRADHAAKLNGATRSIDYLHLPVADGSAPTLKQLKKASEFFLGKKSTLVHGGEGPGRTATGVTALQISAVHGQTLEPYAGTWWGNAGSQVETRRQISVLAELRCILLLSKIRDIHHMDSKKSYAIINAASGYYLSASDDSKTVVAVSPEIVEQGPRTRLEYLWVIKKRDGSDNECELSNRVTHGRFATTKDSGVVIGDPVDNGAKEGRNSLFNISEASGHDHGLYIISPTGSSLVVSIREPSDGPKRLYYTKQTPVLLSEADKIGKYGNWILWPILNASGISS